MFSPSLIWSYQPVLYFLPCFCFCISANFCRALCALAFWSCYLYLVCLLPFLPAFLLSYSRSSHFIYLSCLSNCRYLYHRSARGRPFKYLLREVKGQRIEIEAEKQTETERTVQIDRDGGASCPRFLSFSAHFYFHFQALSRSLFPLFLSSFSFVYLYFFLSNFPFNFPPLPNLPFSFVCDYVTGLLIPSFQTFSLFVLQNFQIRGFLFIEKDTQVCWNLFIIWREEDWKMVKEGFMKEAGGGILKSCAENFGNAQI